MPASPRRHRQLDCGGGSDSNAKYRICWPLDIQMHLKLPLLSLVIAHSFAILATERQSLSGHVLPAWAKLEAVDRLPGANEISLAIGLPLRNQDSLTRLLQQVYDPTSAACHRYLTPDQFTELFGPTEQAYQATIDFALANCLTVTRRHDNRMLLGVKGSAADVEKAFHLNLHVFQHPSETRTFYAPDKEPSLGLGVPVLHISGLNNFAKPHSKSLHAFPAGQKALATPRAGSGPEGAFIGNDFRAAYVPGTSLTGAGQSVGIFALDGYYASDIAAYTKLAKLPVVPLKNVLMDDFNGVPTSRRPGSFNEEVALDIEMAISMAPGLSSVIVYEGSPLATVATINHMLNRMATDNLAKQLSCSWGFDIDVTTRQIFQQFAAQGQSFFIASGDSGAFSGAALQPSDDPYITIVGGTSLTTDTSGAWLSETTWNGSSGGRSTIFSIPPWQRNIDMSSNRGSTTMRNIPDVAMIADNVWAISGRGRSRAFVGTSIASPLWAGFTALINEQATVNGQPPVGFINPAIYAIAKRSDYTKIFHDITTGDNTNADSPDDFHAVTGYDLCTGLGTPTGTNLINALLAPPSDPLVITSPLGFTANGPAGGPFNVTAQSYALTNVGTAPLQWAALNTSTWLDVSPSSGTLAPGGAATVTVGLNAAATSFLIGSWSTAVSFINANTGATQIREFNLLVGNGGFEAGTFESWTLSGSSRDNFVHGIDNSSFTGIPPLPGVEDTEFVHSGAYGAFLSQTALLGSLSQTLPTVAGQKYLISFWMDNPVRGTPNQFRVSWNGQSLFDQVNMNKFAWINMQFTVTAIGTSSAIRFEFRNDRNAFGLDEISVQSLPPPVFQSVSQANGVITFGLMAPKGGKYQVQSTADLNSISWSDLENPVIGTGEVLTISFPTIFPRQRFYRVVETP
ncbi:MAG: hypothetical protein EXS31_10520 [Pedosphaera sp.]|nr:hypothetical protein [Pedosphaera sp.]